MVPPDNLFAPNEFQCPIRRTPHSFVAAIHQCRASGFLTDQSTSVLTDIATCVGSRRPNDMNPVLEKFRQTGETWPFIKLTVVEPQTRSQDLSNRLKPNE
jgi:hypothetical protein